MCWFRNGRIEDLDLNVCILKIMFLLMPSLLINGGPLLKSAVFGLSSLPPLVVGGGGLECEILTASSPGSLLICRLLAICLLVLLPLPSGRVRSGISC